jgi:hypothetical protein
VNLSTIIEDLPIQKVPQKQASPKVKIEFTDHKGAKYSFSVEGPSKESMLKLMEFVETISTKQSDSSSQNEYDTAVDTNFNKVFGLVQNKFRFGSFTSNDVLEAYEQHYQLHTTLSTISTYLARLAERGLLTRSRNGSGWTYKLVKPQKQEQQSEQKPLETVPQLTQSPDLLHP